MRLYQTDQWSMSSDMSGKVVEVAVHWKICVLFRRGRYIALTHKKLH